MTSAEPIPVALEHAFVVEVGSSVLGAFMEVSGLGVSYGTYEHAEGGYNDFVHRLPGRRSPQNVTLKMGLTDRRLLFTWAQRQGSYASPQNVTIRFQNAAGQVFTSFTLQAATPVRWTGPAGNIAANAAATESLEIAHQGVS